MSNISFILPLYKKNRLIMKGFNKSATFSIEFSSSAARMTEESKNNLDFLKDSPKSKASIRETKGLSAARKVEQ